MTDLFGNPFLDLLLLSDTHKFRIMERKTAGVLVNERIHTAILHKQKDFCVNTVVRILNCSEVLFYPFIFRKKKEEKKKSPV